MAGGDNVDHPGKLCGSRENSIKYFEGGTEGLWGKKSDEKAYHQTRTGRKKKLGHDHGDRGIGWSKKKRQNSRSKTRCWCKDYARRGGRPETGQRQD